MKDAVWKEYKVTENPPGRRGLFWVLDPSLSSEKAKPTSLNIFSVCLIHDYAEHSKTAFHLCHCLGVSSDLILLLLHFLQFRALFGAVLHDVGMKAAEQSVQGLFPIHIAAEKVNPDAVVYLLQWGVDVDQQSLSAQKTALHYAVRFLQQGEDKENQTDLVKVLKEFGASHGVEDAEGHVPLFNAIVAGDIELVKLLIDQSPINHADADGDTHLHIAADASSEEILPFLISKGADPMLLNHDDMTPSHVAAQKSLACLKVMDEESRNAGIDLVGTFSQEDTSGHTPLDYAAIRSHKETFRYMWKRIEESPSRNTASYKPVLDRLYGTPPGEIQLSTLQQTFKMLPKPMYDSSSHALTPCVILPL